MAHDLNTITDVSFDLKPRTGHKLSLQYADGCLQRYDVTLSICQSPTCWCQSIDLICTPVDETRIGDAQLRIALDISEQEPRHPPDDAPGRNNAVEQATAASLTTEQWRQLRLILYAEKQQIMEDMDLDSLNVVFPREAIMDSRMVGYEEIFPFAEPLIFLIDEQQWLADDQYCVQLQCNCTDVVLCFFPLPEENSPVDRVSSEIVAAIRYDLQAHSWITEDVPDVPPSSARDLMRALEKSREDMIAELKERRRQLRYLFERETENLTQTLPRPVVAPKKTGRNQPCPCGSGKKYKRCCGH